jgi:hypothetical protein
VLAEVGLRGRQLDAVRAQPREDARGPPDGVVVGRGEHERGAAGVRLHGL